jgi:hypothetical protein
MHKDLVDHLVGHVINSDAGDLYDEWLEIEQALLRWRSSPSG